MSDTDGEIAITHTFHAPRERVFKAWIDPAQFAQWFGAGLPAPRGYTKMDPRPGGDWESTMVLSPDGNQTKKFWGRYREVDQPGRLVMTLTDSDEGFALVTVEFTEHGGETEMSFRQVGPMPADQLAEATKGWKSFFTQLAAVLKDS